MVSKAISVDNQPLQYMKQLDGLRAIAVLAVLWTHYIPIRYSFFGVNWGGFGVRLFFVLSGFLITGILLKCRDHITVKKQTIKFTLRQFYTRRFLRLFPLFYLVLLLAALLNVPSVRETLIWHVLYLSNIYFSIHGSWIENISHLWSLAVEEQFYIIWPWMVLLVPRRLILPLIILLISIGPVSRLISTLAGFNPIAVSILMPNCADTLGFGALLAYLKYQNSKNLHQQTITNIFICIGLPLLVLTQILRHEGIKILQVTVFGDFALGLTFAWLVFKASRGFKGHIGNILEFKPLVHLGKISYGVYLIHNFIPYFNT